jgi:hypothetical protein
LDEETFTTVGKTAFTTGAKLFLLGPSLESASFNETGAWAEAGALAEALAFAENNLLLPRTASSAAAPPAKASARANTFNPDLFILSLLPSLVGLSTLGPQHRLLGFTQLDAEAGLAIIPVVGI